MVDYIHDLKKGDLIKYNFLYSNENEKFGIVYDIKSDPNFSAIVTLLTDGAFDTIPYNIMEFTILE